MGTEEQEPKENLETPKGTTEDKTKNEPKGLTEEEVNKKIEAARQQEKDKLYGQIHSLKDAVNKLTEGAEADKQAKEKAETEANAKVEAERLAKLSNDERLAEHMKQFEEQLAKEAAERRRLEQELADERETQELERYRLQILSGETDIIPDLVRGKSREDIDKSVAFAKSRYQELFQATKAKAEGHVTNNMPRPTDPNPAALDEAELTKSIQQVQIDPKRWARDPKYREEMGAKRDALLDNVGEAYQRQYRG